MPPIIQEPPAQIQENGIDLVAVYRQIMRSTPYTEAIKQRQTDDLANPASDTNTPQGLDAL